MRLRYRFAIIIALLALLVSSCTQEEPKQVLRLPVSISLPMDDTGGMARVAGRRIMGDPGNTERFLLPNYIYIVIMKQDGVNWTPWHIITRIADEDDWTAKRYVGLLQTTGDSVYQYNEQIELLLSNQKFNGRVYIIASAVPLTFNRTLDNTGITSLSDIENLAFSAASDEVQENLQHIYSTPLNYEVDGDYYGAFNSIHSIVPHVDLVLYHVAAKVDITWNVADEVRIKANPAEAVRLTYMDVCNLYRGNAYCFRPMENVAPAVLTEGATIHLVTPTDEGLWWEGRAYCYAIPYTVSGNPNYFPLQMMMRTNGSSDTYRPTLNMKVNTDSPFVPWLRMTFNLTKPLEDKSETKTVEMSGGA